MVTFLSRFLLNLASGQHFKKIIIIHSKTARSYNEIKQLRVLKKKVTLFQQWNKEMLKAKQLPDDRDIIIKRV